LTLTILVKVLFGNIDELVTSKVTLL